ncbi:MAG: 1-deoxy-D-xylulose-5-phosphate reductoisomerase [Fimbriimonas sp.]|nr:1-deoxy-D-xylulose-5-phosphate reductoisomerase [Fimbriimonas sp.]
MKRVVVLGSTGSIGTQTLDVIAQHPDELRVVGLAANRNADLLRQQAERFSVRHLALYEEVPGSGIPFGMNALVHLSTMDEADIVVISVAGVIGLMPTLAAIEAGKDVALASKEVLVSAGEVVMPLVRKHGVTLTPIDSEHSALFQCLQGYRTDQVESLIITASGGPFRSRIKSELADVSVEEALNHPTWRMGGKITIDSATLMNKGLEAIEARWLFNIDIDRIQVVVHPQSVVHSMVKFKDGSVLGQLGWPNMRLPIAYALLYPDRIPNLLPPWNPTDTPTLTFEPVDESTFECIEIARQSARIGGTMPCAMNAANEIAANAFLKGELKFLQIPEVIKLTILEHRPTVPTLDNVLATDEQARQFARKMISRLQAS